MFIPNSANVSITAFDQSGKMVIKILDRYLTKGNHNSSFNIAGLPHGIYTLVLEIDKTKTIMKKIVH
ncbi:MAG: T9SS type A sorting domain-containing protein [Bacteroidales bacterium]|nr:T9SS type A sorting domain-containing protein [Bacteroidales bacterium]